jgi:hypothetical protein
MKDPEQMTKHELVQTMYKLAEVNQKLFEALDYLQRMSINAYSRIDGGTYDLAQAIDGAKEALAKYKAIK